MDWIWKTVSATVGRRKCVWQATAGVSLFAGVSVFNGQKKEPPSFIWMHKPAGKGEIFPFSLIIKELVYIAFEQFTF